MLHAFVEAAREAAIENVSRRQILKGAAAAGSLVLAAPFARAATAPTYKTGAGAMPHGVVIDPRVFVSIAPDGIVSIVAHRAEMGTGVRTSLPMIVADELEADWARVRVTQAEGDEVKYGNQDTDGSRSTRHYLVPMRQIGAAARTMLEEAAAQKWNVKADEVKATNHEIVHGASGRRIGYGELAADAAKLPVPKLDTLRLKDESEFRYIGKGNIPFVDLHDITTGKAQYGADVRLLDMKYAVLVRPPVVGGKLVSFDAKDALAVPGVEQVIEAQGWPWPSKFQPLGGLAVIARNTGAAIKGRDALKVVWDDGANGKYDSEAYRAELEESVRKPGLVVRNEGDVDAALKSADKVIVGEYYLPHLAHVSMEPPAATAHVTDTTAEIWAPVQSPGGTHDDIAKTLGLKPDAVTVHVTLLGGGFGRKSKCDYAIEAALLSRKLKAPVRVQWTREDDIHHDFFHTVSAERIEAGIDKAGTVIAWRHRSAAPSFMSSFVAGAKNEFGDRARAGICRRTVCDPEHTLRESGSSRAYADRLVPLGLEYSTCIRDPDDGCRNRARARPRSQGHAHRADRSRPHRRRREIGERFLELRRTVRTHIQSTPADCAASPSLRRKKANGAASCRKGTALASPRIAVSSATSPPSSRSR